MNVYLLAAAALSVLGGLLHSMLGERLIFSKLTAASLPALLGSTEFAHRVLRAFWHMVSVAWWGFAALLVLLAAVPAGADDRWLTRGIALTFLVSAGLSFGVTRGRHFSWGALLLIAVLTWLGG